MDSVGALTSSSSPFTQGSGTGFSALSSDDFTKLIFTELTNQDPLAPNDTNALLQQVSTIRSIQSDIDLTGSLKSLVSQNEFASAATLIGKPVTGYTEAFDRVSGRVRSVARGAEGPVLTLEDGVQVPVRWLEQVDAPTTP
jgi:flagellar basal-body rod modification protein FlgD